MTRTALFQTNRTQAVRLPKDVAFPNDVVEVEIVKRGRSRIISPAGMAWDDFFDAPGIDLGARDQPAMQDRDVF
ncbi:antitoxin [Escherichia coli]|nr:antitoxin [Salmonella enterica subsp. enterica]EBU7498103.1 antitoxin [Salmonella enterica subsp. enterica serovar Typhi]EBU8132020.1 antitoxin [Salmonella enterica subsp. enterica serovar Java]EBW1603930.1 antitoxin [Salmonella enterica subsp. enterica serovar Kottbus]EBW2250114.1 antitoxin [Salmonella enterica subsp. enterica serovar Enteritidis]EBX4817128.1 antitoxin [Salmonella enterica subsp. enterica serovar Newport]ECD4520294.1 antitoxin [Salmonella enterica subsp. enterica serovar 